MFQCTMATSRLNDGVGGVSVERLGGMFVFSEMW